MRQLHIFTALFSMLLAFSSYATPLHFNVKGQIDTSMSSGPSPIAHGTSVTGWYELDWGKAKFETDTPHSTIYSGILTYKFLIGGVTLTGTHSNIEYHSLTSTISQNSAFMEFKDQYPTLLNSGSFLPVEDLFFRISTLNGVRKVWFNYDSVPDFDNHNNVYSGICELAETSLAHVAESSSFIIFIIGLMSIFFTRTQRKI